MRFLEEDRQLTSKANSDIDPVVVMADIAAGMEDLTFETVRLDVLNKASKALEKSIQLDEDIAASGVANRATVTYGIEALEITSIFLGVDGNFEAMAAGLEDNDQETPKKEKEGFLAKIKNAAIKTWERIMEFIQNIIDKVREFFNSKATEKTAEKAGKAAEEVEKATGSENKKPECKDKDKAKETKEKIAKIAGDYIYVNGMKSIKDLEDYIQNYLLDKSAIEAAEAFKNIFDKDILNIVNGFKLVESEIKNPTDKAKIKEALASKIYPVIKNMKLPEIKQNKVAEKLIKEYEDEILKEAGIDEKNDYEYTIIYNGTSYNTSKKSYVMSCGVLAKNKKMLGEIDEFIKTLDEDNKTVKKAVVGSLKKIKDVLNFAKADVDVEISIKDLTNKIEPFSASELKDLEKRLKDYPENSKKVTDKIKSNFDKTKEDIDKIIDDVKKFDYVGSDLATIISSVINNLSITVRYRLILLSNRVLNLGNAIIELTENCVDTTPSKVF